MKKVFILVAVAFVSFYNNAQMPKRIEIRYNQAKNYHVDDSVDYKELLKTTPTFTSTTSDTGLKIFDLSNKQVSFYENGKLIASRPLLSISFINGIYHFEIADTDNRNGDLLITKQDIDIIKNISVYSWYWNADTNKSCAIAAVNPKINIIR
jgi:hypothetical protein